MIKTYLGMDQTEPQTDYYCLYLLTSRSTGSGHLHLDLCLWWFLCTVPAHGYAYPPNVLASLSPIGYVRTNSDILRMFLCL